MALPMFSAYLDANQATTQQKEMNESELYALYIQWLIKDQNIQKATVKELLLQIQAISCCVQRQAQKNIASELAAPDLDDNAINQLAAPDLNDNAINKSVLTLFQTMSLHVPDEGFKDLSSVLFTVTTVLSGISALFIGAAFAPQLPIGGAIALWTIGALFGSLALYILKEYNNHRVEKNSYNQAENDALVLATTAIAPMVSPTPTPTSSINNAVTCTLKAALYTDIFNLNQHSENQQAEIRLSTLGQFLTPRV